MVCMGVKSSAIHEVREMDISTFELLDIDRRNLAASLQISRFSAWRLQLCLKSSPYAAADHHPVADLNASAPLLFWTADLHDGVRVDIISTLTTLGHRVIPGGHKLNDGPYPHVFGSPLVEWPERPLPAAIRDRHKVSDPLSEEHIRDLVAHYRHDPQMAAVDAFVCRPPRPPLRPPAPPRARLRPHPLSARAIAIRSPPPRPRRPAGGRRGGRAAGRGRAASPRPSARRGCRCACR
jgi:hypothetical protein